MWPSRSVPVPRALATSMAVPTVRLSVRRSTFRRWWVRAGPVFNVRGTEVFGLTDAQIAEWYRRLSDPRPRQRIYLQEKSAI